MQTTKTDSIIATQSLEGYILPLLHTTPSYIHNMHFKLRISPQCYIQLNLPTYNTRNKGKHQYENVASAHVDYTTLVATQIGDTKTAVLSHMTKYGQSDVNDYRAIGSSGMYSYVFLKPLYESETNITMYKFAKIGYSVIQFIERFDMDQDVGGQPQFWCIPNSGHLFSDKDRPQWKQEFESHSETMINNFKKYIINSC